MEINKEEQLDFCRVKKIDEKGFGFLKSLYFKQDIFFHITQIKNDLIREKIEKMKRGDFFLFFTSKETKDNRRKVKFIWYDLDSVPNILIPKFIQKLIFEFNDGTTNLFDLLFVVNELNRLTYLSKENFSLILKSKKITNTPTAIIPYLQPNELSELGEILNIEACWKSIKIPYWLEEVTEKIYGLNFLQKVKAGR